MKSNHIIERYGGITKEEPLSCLENELTLEGTCVFEATSPYFGYYNEVKSGTQPHMIFFILDEQFTHEHLVRVTSKVQKKVDFHIDAVTGSINILNQTCYVIQFLNLTEYSHIEMVQQRYIDEGLVFKGKPQNFTTQMGLIKLKSFFKLNEIGDGLYLDHKLENIGYFIIDNNIEWEQFKQITKEVKQNTKLLFFDASRAYFYEGEQIIDMVQIYRENLTRENLETIKDRYLKLINYLE